MKAICGRCLKLFNWFSVCGGRISDMTCPGCGTRTMKLAWWTPAGYVTVQPRNRFPSRSIGRKYRDPVPDLSPPAAPPPAAMPAAPAPLSAELAALWIDLGGEA